MGGSLHPYTNLLPLSNTLHCYHWLLLSCKEETPEQLVIQLKYWRIKKLEIRAEKHQETSLGKKVILKKKIFSKVFHRQKIKAAIISTTFKILQGLQAQSGLPCYH